MVKHCRNEQMSNTIERKKCQTRQKGIKTKKSRNEQTSNIRERNKDKIHRKENMRIDRGVSIKSGQKGKISKIETTKGRYGGKELRLKLIAKRGEYKE